MSGHIWLDGHTFLRTAIPGVFVQGHAQPPDAPVTPMAPMFPGLATPSSVPEAAPVQ